MKKLLFITVMMASLGAAAQSDKFTNAMQPKVVAFDTTRNVEGLKSLANAFERIADAEKTQWLPYYYAALAHVNSGTFLMNTGNPMAGGMTGVLDPIADKAESLLLKAEALSKDNSEIWVVKKLIATLRMMGDPMSRYMQYGPQAQQALETARKLDPANPRVDLLEGQDKFYTPEQFGGSKTEAKRLFEEAVKKFDAAKPLSSIDPSWGRGTTQYFLSQVK